MNVSAKPIPIKRCHHDSTRGDGWLDTHCLRCGEDGYWQYGSRVAEVEIHPSGKVLTRLLEQADSQDTPQDRVVG